MSLPPNEERSEVKTSNGLVGFKIDRGTKCDAECVPQTIFHIDGRPYTARFLDSSFDVDDKVSVVFEPVGLD